MTLAGSDWIQLELGGSTLLTSITVPFSFELAYEPGWIRLDPARSGWIQLDIAGSGRIHLIN